MEDLSALAWRRTGVGAARRSLDVVVSMIVLVAGLPVLFVIALAIRCTSRGPILFLQQRVGEGGAAFTLYKFRTMIARSSGPEFTVPDDPRVVLGWAECSAPGISTSCLSSATSCGVR